MLKRVLAIAAAFALAGTLIAVAAVSGASLGSAASSGSGASSAPKLHPGQFVSVIDNPYYPLPVGRTLIYTGVRDGQKQIDRVHVTSRKKEILGISATVVSDVATHHGTLLEKTEDWFAQDKDGNVWYLGEDTKAYEPDGTVDTSGSWESGVNGAVPGLIMEADPQIPDAYRQEYLRGEAEDTAWVIQRGLTLTVPYKTVHNVLRSLEFTQLEPKVIDTKYYAPGLGIVLERSLSGDHEVAELARVID
jgi:hypothetical protein